MEKQTIRVRKVGAVTFGIVLIVTGVLFLLKIFLPGLDYGVIVHFWPVILIGLGIEVLLGCRWKTFEIRNEMGQLVEQSKVGYDVPAILLTIVLTGFSLCMGIMDVVLSHAQGISQHIHF